MHWKPVPLNQSEGKGKITFRRLLLAKRLYLHAFEHSQYASDIDKIIAIHNFHNAVEIVLKTIILHYELHRDVYVKFKELVRIVDKDKVFRDYGVELPYRADLDDLNQVRNLSQHNAHEPAESTITKWGVITRSFLVKTYQTYFELDFDNISQIDLVTDIDLRGLLAQSLEVLRNHMIEESIAWAAVAVKIALDEILADEALNYFDLITTAMGVLDDFELDSGEASLLFAIQYKFQDLEYSISLLSRKVDMLAYRRFKQLTPSIEFVSELPFRARWGWGRQAKTGLTEETGRWVHNFALQLIVDLQNFETEKLLLSEHHKNIVRKLLDAEGDVFIHT